ncbi:hypothetical protein [Streptomyces sp. B27]|uniref:hypothetical protein n=1 Tax=Streptomyces sp. B27 TaxID=2485015 RepID=UPI000FDC275B|nr:hypothetical protein [Streptomyces sp. B27]
MMGSEFIARSISFGSISGFGVGGSLEQLDSLIALSYVDDFSGKKDSRILRRDYGLFEVSLGGHPDWTCRALTLEVHRMSHSSELRDEIYERLGVRFESFTSWSDVLRDYGLIPGSRTLEVLDESPEYRVFGERSVGASVHVVNDPSAARGEAPGFGDVWSLEIISPRFM